MTEPVRFLGMNIRGTPPMQRSAVEHDLRAAKDRCNVLVTQEFRWPWYWRAASKVLGGDWSSSPGYVRGRLRPVRGAQSVKWKRARFKRVRTRTALLHEGVAGISETRWLRAVLLEDRETKLRFWAGTTHFVVGGDEWTDPPRRKAIMARDLMALDAFLTRRRRSGWPIIFQLDANIRPQVWAYGEFSRVLAKHGAVLHGERGVEYLLTIDGRKARVAVDAAWRVPVADLKTDHEGRGITARLIPTPRRRRKP
jgi:hypothetical protein